MATSWKFYTTVTEAWDAMYADIKAAKHSIDLEQYILEYSPATARSFDLLKEKALGGLRVRILCDMVGSYQVFDSPVMRGLREAGAEVVFFNPISAWRVSSFSAWFFRDHRKLLIIDGNVAHTGGVGFNEHMADWRDTNICITGPVVDQMREAFDRMWVGERSGNLVRLKKPPEPREKFAFVTNAPKLRDHKLYKELSKSIRGARAYIYLTTPYFIPSLRFFRRLRNAARRGVDVRLLLPRASDSIIADVGAHSYFGLAMKAGIRIFLYGGRILHAKTGVIDDRWATVGSMNLDTQSFVFSYEGNLVTSDERCVGELKKQFFNDCSHAEEVQRSAWEKRSRIDRFLEALTWPIHWAI